MSHVVSHTCSFHGGSFQPNVIYYKWEKRWLGNADDSVHCVYIIYIYIYRYICMYVCIYVHTHTHTHIYIYIYTYTYIHVHTHAQHTYKRAWICSPCRWMLMLISYNSDIKITRNNVCIHMIHTYVWVPVCMYVWCMYVYRMSRI